MAETTRKDRQNHDNEQRNVRRLEWTLVDPTPVNMLHEQRRWDSIEMVRRLAMPTYILCICRAINQ